MVVGKIKYIFVHKKAIRRKEMNNAIWIQAESGMYMLDIENCSLAYRKEMYKLLDNRFMKDK